MARLIIDCKVSDGPTSRRTTGPKSAARSRRLPRKSNPFTRGETGGQYRPLSEKDIGLIKSNIYRILEEIGFGDATPHCIEACTAVGAIMGNDGRLHMPWDAVEKALAVCERNLVLYGQDSKHDLQISGQKVHFSTAGAAVMVPDY